MKETSEREANNLISERLILKTVPIKTQTIGHYLKSEDNGLYTTKCEKQKATLSFSLHS